MNEAKVTKIQPDNGDASALVQTPPLPKQETSQATLSTLGDISLAASDSISRTMASPQTTQWFPILGFFFLLYFATCFAALFSIQRNPRVCTLVAPLLPVLAGTAAFWWRQRWKFRATDERSNSQAWQNALGSLSHEATNAANAIRANLTGFRLAHPQTSQAELLNAIERATARIDKAVQKSNGLLSSKSKAD